MINLTKLALPLLFLPGLAGAQTSGSKPFGQADLQRIVDELDKAIPHNAKFVYPVQCSIVDSKTVNAYATVEKTSAGYQTKMVVFTGFVSSVDNNERLIRACVAHELSHLSQGHPLESRPGAGDLMNLWVRQQEYDADKYGAAALVKTGHPKQDMIDLLLDLDRDRGHAGTWLYNLTADHADAKARAARLSDNPQALRALLLYDTGLAYEDSREHLIAEKIFDAAAEIWPSLTEANINAAKCSLMYYYDALPKAVRLTWWRPDFGPLITDPHVAPKATEVTDQDRQAWKDAVAECEKAVKTNPGSDAAMEMLALAQVLEPDGTKDTVQKGIVWFAAHVGSAGDAATKLRYANNEGVGYQRLGDLDHAYGSIIDAQRGSDVFNPALGENLGRVTVKGRSKDDDVLAANVLFTWLGNTPQSSPNWGVVKSTFDSILAARSLQAKPIESTPAYLCRVTTLVTSDKQLGLLLPASGVTKVLGEPSKGGFYDERWPDLKEIQYHGGAVRILTEDGEVMRLTSSEPGAYLLLKPVDPTSTRTIEIKVGMTKAELFSHLNEKATVQKDLIEGGDLKTWSYFPGLGMGVLLENDVVKAITVTPVKSAE